MPTTCSGRPVAAASDEIGIELVFDARIALGRQHRVGAAEDVLLDGSVLDDGLDQQVGRDELADRRDACERLVGVGPALRGELDEAARASSAARARSHRETSRTARRAGPMRPRPARSRRPSGLRRRPAHARAPSRRTLPFAHARATRDNEPTPRRSSGSASAAGRSATGTSIRPSELDRLEVDWSRWEKRIERPPAGWAIFVAEGRGRLLGFVALGPSRDEHGVGEIYAIYVDPTTGGGARAAR